MVHGRHPGKRFHGVIALALAAALSACGGSGGSGGDSDSNDGTAGTTLVDTQVCSANNPYRANADAVTATGSITTEKAWLRSFFNSWYLWYGQVPTVDAMAAQYSDDTPTGFYGSMEAYFDALIVTSEDRFSWMEDTKTFNAWQSLSSAFDYGILWASISSTVPRVLKVGAIEAAGPAVNLFQRGDSVTAVDGVSMQDETASGIDAINAGLDGSDGKAHTITFTRNGTSMSRTIAAAYYTADPVPITEVLTSTTGTKVGYIHFTTHVTAAESKLAAAITSFTSQGVTDVVLDMRYNGGGLLDTASRAAYMLAGPTRTSGQTFEAIVHNAKHSDANSTSLFNTTDADGNTLPYLTLSRVFVLTTKATCSASEAVINGLRGVGVNVIQVGTTSCGKPYGMYAWDNCGITYLTIDFKGFNAQGTAVSTSGMTPTCTVADDFDHALGNASEGLLATALAWDTQACTASVAASSKTLVTQRAGPAITLPSHPLRENAILPRP